VVGFRWIVPRLRKSLKNLHCRLFHQTPTKTDRTWKELEVLPRKLGAEEREKATSAGHPEKASATNLPSLSPQEGNKRLGETGSSTEEKMGPRCGAPETKRGEDSSPTSSKGSPSRINFRNNECTGGKLKI